MYPLQAPQDEFGIRDPYGRGPSWIPQGAQFGQQPGGVRGLLRDPNLALALLANSDGPRRQSFGQILGQSALQAKGMAQQQQDAELERQYRMAQMQALQSGGGSRSPYGAIPVERVTPDSLKRFEASGKYSDLEFIPEQKQLMDTAEMRNYKFRSQLPSDAARAEFDNLVRQNFDISKIGGVQTQIRKGPTPQLTPLGSLSNELYAASALKNAESEAAAIGAGQGSIIADIQKKGANSKTINDTLDIADPLIDAATGSLSGAAIDKLASVFGKAPEGAQAIAQLQILQAGLMLNMPRMEGPQSDRDVELYRQAAASLGDPMVPRATKKAAVSTIRQIQQKYAERAQQVNQPFKPTIYPAGSPQDDSRRAQEFNSLLDKYAPRK